MVQHPKKIVGDRTALEGQQELLEGSLELVAREYRSAVGEGMQEPVVILLDCEDSIGGQIVRSWLGGDAVDEAISGQRAEDPSGETTTVFARAFPLADCAEQIPAVFPYLAPVFAQALPADRFLAISVASGGASALSVPFAALDVLPFSKK